MAKKKTDEAPPVKSTVTRKGASIVRKYEDGTVQRLTLHSAQAAADYVASHNEQEG